MIVRVRLFAMLREHARADTIELHLDDNATVAEALRALREGSQLGELLQRVPIQMAVNRDYATPQTRLAADDELALIPPLSGGSETSESQVHSRVTDEPLSIDRLSDAVRRADAGAVVVFCGITREVERLEYEAYREMAEERMALIARECLARHGLKAIALEHRTGSVPLSEPSVIVAVSAAHRAEAFAGASDAIDRIKAEAPIWKREVPADGAQRWVVGVAPTPSIATGQELAPDATNPTTYVEADRVPKLAREDKR
jgi:molybdopterin synthase catalytic subunit